MRTIIVTKLPNGLYEMYEKGKHVGMEYFVELPDYLTEKYLILRMVDQQTTVLNVGRRTVENQFIIYLED